MHSEILENKSNFPSKFFCKYINYKLLKIYRFLEDEGVIYKLEKDKGYYNYYISAFKESNNYRMKFKFNH